jgi:nucleotide-binding universal stress UspA family protein
VAEALTSLEGCGGDLTTEVVAVPGRSAAATLEDEAAASDAGMVLLGSAVPRDKGRVVVGSTAARLLHSSAIPVAIATAGYRAPAGGRIARATCAFRTDEESQFALARTAELCRETGAKLRVVTFGVLGATMYPPEVLGESQVLEAYVESTAKAPEASVTALPDGGDWVETVVATGRDWPEALGRLDWDEYDVLVVGSSTRGVLSRVFIGTMLNKRADGPFDVVVWSHRATPRNRWLT